MLISSVGSCNVLACYTREAIIVSLSFVCRIGSDNQPRRITWLH
ncbi:hypothetical protein [Vibrio phage 33Fb.4]|nr:hypothetical protein [Vibrio phage 27Ua.3]UZM04666.1 hypothetical protein [Vibrio phage 31Fb.4]WAG58470.1 hypothetical protein [Vibrio phage 33Fb.4]